MTQKDLSELYCWIRAANQHTPDEVIDFMYQAATEKLLKEQNEAAEKHETKNFIETIERKSKEENDERD